MGAKYRSSPRAYAAKGPPTDQPLQEVVSSGQQEGIWESGENHWDLDNIVLIVLGNGDQQFGGRIFWEMAISPGIVSFITLKVASLTQSGRASAKQLKSRQIRDYHWS